MFDYYPILKRIAKILPDALNPVAQKAREVYNDEKSFYMDLYKRTVAQADTVKLPCSYFLNPLEVSFFYELRTNSPQASQQIFATPKKRGKTTVY